MENASKALLIAGAILIAILLIGIAMMVFGNINGLIGSAGQQADQMEVSAFNTRFEQYAGERVSGSNVKTLINNINASNATYADDESRQITIKDSDTGITATTWSAGNPVKITGTIGNNFRYKVVFDTNKAGFITTVTIQQKK